MDLRERIDKAAERHEAERHEAEKTQLYRPDGSKVYADAEHEEREAAIRREFFAEMDRIEADVERRIADAEGALLVAEHSDPTDALSPEELVVASAKRDFVSDEVWALPLEALERRCRVVLAQGDRPTMFLHALYAGQRVGAEAGSAARQYLDRLHEGSSIAAEENGAPAVRAVVAELWAKLDPDAQRRREAARKGLEEGRELKSYLYVRRRGAKSHAELFLNRKYAGG